MKSFIAFSKKELTEGFRTGKIIILGILFLLFGIMNPAIAKLTPWLLELFAESMDESGIIITDIVVNANSSWTQFFKNIPMALIVFVIIYSSIFTKEYESNTLLLVISKGLSRYKILLSKTLYLFTIWTLGYFLCYGVTYAYTVSFWDNSIAIGLTPAILMWYLFGIFIISLIVLFSVIFNNNTGVLLGVGSTTVILYVISFIPNLTKYIPTTLMNVNSLLVGKEVVSDYLLTIIITMILSIISILLSIPILNKKQL